uniref:Auxin-responsive protein n=1 Tax=Oryza barthii TaxID=65489 RepID=A0A0D3GKH4_9ORYZ
MMVMGYLLAPKKGGRRRRGKDQPSAAAHHGESDDGLRETLLEPAFRDLMERAADEFGFAQAGGLRVPCGEDDFEDLLRRLRRKNGGAAAAKAKKAIS